MKLVAYFSYTGTARKVSEKVAAIVAADLFEIKTQKPYSSDYKTCIEEAKVEWKSNARPALEGQVEDMADYDTIILGFPNWCGTCPMAVLSFLEQYDLQGKKLYAFVTNGGGGCGSSTADIKKAAPAAEVVEAVDGNDLSDVAIKEWLGL